MNGIIARFKVVIERAFLFESGLRGRAVLVPETFVGTDVNVQLIIQIDVGPAGVDHAEIYQIRGLLKHVSAGLDPAYFFIDHLIAQGERAL
jgi:hypothetical protein